MEWFLLGAFVGVIIVGVEIEYKAHKERIRKIVERENMD